MNFSRIGTVQIFNRRSEISFPEREPRGSEAVDRDRQVFRLNLTFIRRDDGCMFLHVVYFSLKYSKECPCSN